MIQIVPQWSVTFYFDNGNNVELIVSDHFWANVMRTVANLSFGQKRVARIEIKPAP